MTTAHDHPIACACATCGAVLSGIPHDFAMRWPDVVFRLAPEERAARVLAPDGPRPDWMVLDDRHFYIRGLLLLALADGGEFRYGLWLEVDRETMRGVFSVWDTPEKYMQIRFRARIANAVAPWEQRIVAAAVVAAPRTASERPYVVDADDTWLKADLQSVWLLTATPGGQPLLRMRDP